MAVAQSLREKLKNAEAENDELEATNEDLKIEISNLKRYSELIDSRHKEICRAEEQANMKVLDLLDEVQKLTKEN